MDDREICGLCHKPMSAFEDLVFKGRDVRWCEDCYNGNTEAARKLMGELGEEHFVGVNKDEPPIEIRHQDLEPAYAGKFRSHCPTCKLGVLLVKRDQTTFELLREDNCILCGQRFVYTDFDGSDECAILDRRKEVKP